MTRTTEDFIAAIKQIRDYAKSYQGKKRKKFYDDLYAMLAVPLPLRNNAAHVKKMYLGAIGALTFEIQPPTSHTYAKVKDKLNSSLAEFKLETINIAVYSDAGMEEGYRSVGESQEESVQISPIEPLEDSLPKKRRLTHMHQALVDKFRDEIPNVNRPFRNRRQERG